MIFIVVKFTVRPEYSEQWIDLVDDFTQATRQEAGNLWFEWSRSVENPDQFVLLEAFRPCIRQAWLPKSAANRMHLFAEELRPRRDRQLTLFDDLSSQADAVASLKKAVNDRHGQFILRSAATPALGRVYADRANEYDICDVRGKTCF